MCKPHYRRDYYSRNKARENATNKAYLDARPDYQRERHAAWGESKYGAERQARAAAAARRLASTHKTCTACLVHMPKTEFFTDPRRIDGLYSHCRECFKGHCRAAYDPVKTARHGLLYRNAPGQKEAAADRQRRWYAANPEKAREQTRRYQARKMSATIGDVDYSAILIRDGMTCHICSVDILTMSDLHFDHVHPLSKGGAHSMENIKPSHAFCNLSKGATIIT
jgi:5-methylcytosine-specific restriction endonuclease McrA